MWAKQDIVLDLKGSAPVLLSTTLFTGVAGFITMYLSAFMTNVTPTSDFVHDYESRFKDNFTDQTISLNGGLTGYGDDQWSYYYYAASHGVASRSSRRSSSSARSCCCCAAGGCRWAR